MKRDVVDSSLFSDIQTSFTVMRQTANVRIVNGQVYCRGMHVCNIPHNTSFGMSKEGDIYYWNFYPRTFVRSRYMMLLTIKDSYVDAFETFTRAWIARNMPTKSVLKIVYVFLLGRKSFLTAMLS